MCDSHAEPDAAETRELRNELRRLIAETERILQQSRHEDEAFKRSQQRASALLDELKDMGLC